MPFQFDNEAFIKPLAGLLERNPVAAASTLIAGGWYAPREVSNLPAAGLQQVFGSKSAACDMVDFDACERRPWLLGRWHTDGHDWLMESRREIQFVRG